MSFLLGRGSTSFARSPLPTTASTALHSPVASSSSVLYDASSPGGREEDEDNDELEAAFGDSHDGDDVEIGDRHARFNVDGSITLEEAQLLSPRAQENGNMRNALARSNSATLSDDSMLQRGSSGGGYDFERDPYERSRMIARPASRWNGVNTRRSSNNRRRNLGHASSNALFRTLQNAIPLRWRRYGLLDNTEDLSFSGSRTDGTANHAYEEEDEDDNWDAPPPSMPGLYGGGIHNDGVFSNLMAKPGGRLADRGGQEIVGGDDEAREKEIPPVSQIASIPADKVGNSVRFSLTTQAYEMAVLDAAPPYFDTTVHAPSGSGGYLSAFGGASTGGGIDDILIEGLPLGNIFSFFWSLLVSMSFQFVGFLLTTLLSTSHAAKNGSRAGLGITLIQYGLFLQSHENDDARNYGNKEIISQGQDEWAAFWGQDPASSIKAAVASATATLSAPSRTLPTGVPHLMGNSSLDGPILLDGTASVSGVAGSWLSMILMIGGWVGCLETPHSHFSGLI